MNNFQERLGSAKTQKERWGLFHQAETDEQRELILRQILSKAKNIGEIGRVHLHAPAHSALEAEAMKQLGDEQGLIIPPV
ncbi:MAG: hypothetical protein UV60_C0006G0025 [Parcubacteria group bacterium GW2011_GWA2_43_11]|nr:MAG: hypothetical protein UU89_C0005G0022 [Parcubacteria group bacterium GW2011_GWC2_42_11]KKS85673.1 MAG: hypothetical protein UV60_C0006G0025 [Parcubacteria group bacterium GW2011_GWA2_43_11]